MAADQSDGLAAALERALLVSRHGVVIFGGGGEALFANPVARGLLDGGEADLPALGERLARELPVARVLAGGERCVDCALERPGEDGPRELRADLEPLRDDAGRVTGAVLWVEDVTPVRRARAALEFAEQRFQAYLDQSFEAIALHRADEGLVYVNPAALRLLGYGDSGPLLGRPAIEVVHPDDRAMVAERILQMREQGQAVSVIEERWLRADGGFAPLQVAALPVTYRGKPTIMVLGIDLGERRRLLEEARRRAAELESVLENMVDAVLVWDARGRLRQINHAGRVLLGAGVEAIGIGREQTMAILSPVHPDDSELAFDELPSSRALAGETVRQTDLICRPRDLPPIYVRVSSVPLRDEAGTVVGAVEVIRDLTELTELDRLKDEFIRVAAHELKTPVTVVKSYAQATLRMVSGLPPEARRLVKGIDRGADRIARIVGDLVDVSALHFGRLHLLPQRFDLGPLVSEAVARASGRAAQLHVRMSRCEPATVLADRGRLAQVLDILLDNALLFSPAGGSVEVELHCEGPSAVLSVRDHGPGIPQEKQSRIFERFYRAHTGTAYDYGGMGVSLYIAREVVRRHGGNLSVESRPGETTFTVRLPLAEGGGAEASAAPRE